jgi:hypothetical protein
LSNINDNIKQISFSFNTSELIEFAGKDCEKSCPVWQRLGYEFKEHNSPLLYWFEIESEVDNSEILSRLQLFRVEKSKTDIDFRAIPAFRNNSLDNKTKVLYVGCCRTTKLIDRMFWHFDYYNVGRTQGLQLCHWAREFNLSIKLNVITFPREAKNLIEVYERFFAEKLQPLIGMH